MMIIISSFQNWTKNLDLYLKSRSQFDECCFIFVQVKQLKQELHSFSFSKIH